MTPQTQTAAVRGAGERLAIQEVTAAQSLQMLSGRTAANCLEGKVDSADVNSSCCCHPNCAVATTTTKRSVI